MHLLSPTKAKVWSAIAIWVSYGVATWLGNFVGEKVYRATHPDLFNKMVDAMVPQMKEAMGELASLGIQLILLQFALSLLVAYVCAAAILHFATPSLRTQSSGEASQAANG